MSRCASRIRRSAISGVILLFAVAAPRANADPADFYRGKTVEILVGFSPGGGFDAYARTLARHIGNHIPGNPGVVVRNYAGAGSLRLARYLGEAAPHDGLTFGTIDNGLLVASLTNKKITFDASKLKWVGAITKDPQVAFTGKLSPVKSFADLTKSNTAFGGTGKDDIRYACEAALKKVSGGNIKIVTGYPGTADVALAIEKGELDGSCESWSSVKATKSEWLRDKRINLLVQYSSERQKDLPDVPLLSDFAKSPIERDALNLIFSSSEVGRPFGAPAGVPADRLDALRRAFDATVKDPEFVADAAKQKLEADPSKGEAFEAYLKKVYASSPAVIEYARKLIE